MTLEFRHLETVYWIDRLGSYGAAAKRLHTTQPNISMRIDEIERRLATSIFKGGVRRTQLNQMGLLNFEWVV